MELKERLMRLGAMGALMSGSGPTVYGLFRDRSALKEAYVALPSGALGGKAFRADQDRLS